MDSRLGERSRLRLPAPPLGASDVVVVRGGAHAGGLEGKPHKRKVGLQGTDVGYQGTLVPLPSDGYRPRADEDAGRL
jgi:hypothetical protein